MGAPILDWLLNPTGLTAHGFCLSWSPGLVSLHAASDALIGLSYFSIPLAIGAFKQRRTDLKFGWVATLFMAFILACGSTHLWSIVTLWFPAYGVEGVIKAVTALLSIATAVLLWPLIPQLVALPSTDQLAALNTQLASQVADQAEMAEQLRVSESRLQQVNQELEQRVAQRTAELTALNLQLEQALAEKTLAQNTLSKSEAEFRASFEAAAVGKMQSNPVTGVITRVNNAFAQMLGYLPEEMIGRTGADLTHPEDAVEDVSIFADVLAGRLPVYVREKRFLRKTGETVWGRMSATVVRSPQDAQPILTVSVIENIDERYKAQQALESTKLALETALAQRTHALAERDLLLREVYHRVKNNLQIIDSMITLQAHGLTDQGAQTALSNLRGRVHALGLVHQQLMESPDLETFNVAPFLNDLVTNIIRGGPSRNISLSVEVQPLDIGIDLGIPLGLLVTELVTNSLKHAFPDGVGEVQLRLERQPDGDILLVVGDDGVGYLSRDQSIHGSEASLGTQIIRGLVMQMGGLMTTRHDDGVRVEIRLPAPVTH